MPTAKQVARHGRRRLEQLMRGGARKMIVGKLQTDNSVTVAGAPVGKIWVRSHPASREETAVWTSKIYLPNAQVWVAAGLSGEDEIKGLVYPETAAALGSKTPFAETSPISGDINVLEVHGQNIVPGRLRAYASSGSMLVYVEPFAHEYGRFEGGTIDMTGHTPVSAGANQWVAVATDPKTNTLYAYDGAEDYNTAANMGVADAFAIVVPSGYYPNGALVLNAATTEVTPSNRFIDLRVHAGMRGQLELDDLANVNAAGKADGDTLVWDLGAGEWTPAAAVAGAIDVSDGTTTVSPATELLFDATKFDVVDNGGGQAEVTLAPGAVIASGSKTRITETILYENTLGSDGAWDVENSDLAAGAGDFTDYDELVIELRDMRGTVSAEQDRLLLLFGTGGGGLDTTATNYYSSGIYAGTDVGNVFGGGTIDNAEIAALPGATAPANTVSDWTIRILNPASSSHKNASANGQLRWRTTSQVYMGYALTWENTGAIDRIGIRTDNHATDLIAAGASIRIIGRREEAIGGLDTSTANVSNPPTDAELDSALGTPATVGAGYQCLLDDGGLDANVYLVASNGTSWWYMALTKAT